LAAPVVNYLDDLAIPSRVHAIEAQDLDAQDAELFDGLACSFQSQGLLCHAKHRNLSSESLSSSEG